MAGELATLLATELHITKLKAGEALCVVGEAADSMPPGMKTAIALWKSNTAGWKIPYKWRF